MFLTNNSPDLYALTSCIMFRKILVFSTASRTMTTSEFEWKLLTLSSGVSPVFPEISGNIEFPENLQPSTPSPDWNCQWGPSGARIAYTRAMSEHRCFPKKRLSTHTMHYKWHHRNLSKMATSHWKGNESRIIISCCTSILTAAVVR